MSSIAREELLELAALVLGSALASAVLTGLLVLAAPRLGLVDPPGGPDGARKIQSRPIPLVGGVAVALVVFAATALGIPSLLGWAGMSWTGPAAVALAFLVGLIDDWSPHGLRPALKGVLQLAASVPLAFAFLSWNGTGEWGAAVVLVLVAVLAQNAINTFDNSDGSAALLGAAALCATPPVAAAALLGFLPWNLIGRRRAYLGDSGSHMLGMMIAAWPPAWPALTLPLADLARLSVLRLREGRRPWQGDRRHLAHRLQARGLSPPAVAMIQFAIALPSVAGGMTWFLLERGDVVLAGMLVTIAFFAITLRWAPDPECAVPRDA